MVNGYAVTAKPVPLSVNLMNCKERYILDYQLIRTNNHILIPYSIVDFFTPLMEKLFTSLL